MYLKNILSIYMRVDLGGVQAGMAQQRLNYAQVDPCLQEVGGKGMAESVGCDLLFETSFQSLLLQYLPKPHTGELSTAVIQKQQVAVFKLQEFRPGLCKIGAQKLLQYIHVRHKSLL